MHYIPDYSICCLSQLYLRKKCSTAAALGLKRFTNTYTHAHTNTHAHAHTDKHTHTHKHKYTHTNTNAHARTHAHLSKSFSLGIVDSLDRMVCKSVLGISG